MKCHPNDATLLLHTAWQRLRAEYVELAEHQKAGAPVDVATLAQRFIDMNNALETFLSSTVPGALSEE